MKKVMILVLLINMLIGCSSSKPTPNWLLASHNYIENYKSSYLIGHYDIAETFFKKAIQEVKQSGNLDIFEKLYLTQYALQAALIEDIDNKAYMKLEEIHYVKENSNFCKFLKANFDKVDKKLLPEQYQDFFEMIIKKKDIGKSILKMEGDDYSKLIAIGLAVRKGYADENILNTAVDISSNNGWTKALIIYLKELANYYKKAKADAKAVNVLKKIKLLSET